MNDIPHIFIAYAHKDRESLLKLKTHLSILERRGHCRIFYDGEITPGERWDDRLKKELHLADIFLLLVSEDFLASDYINNVELPTILEKEKNKEGRVVPIILRKCLWEYTDLQQLQVVRDNGRPIEETNGHGAAALAIAKVIESHQQAIKKIKEAEEQAQREKDAVEHQRLAAALAARQEQERLRVQEEEATKRRQAEEAERKRQAEERRHQQAAEAERQRLAATEKQQRQAARRKKQQAQLTAAVSRFRSPYAWGGALALVVLSIFIPQLCKDDQPKPMVGIEEPVDTTQTNPKEAQIDTLPVAQPPPETEPTTTTFKAPKMERIAGGTFTMGCDVQRDGDCQDDEKPLHQVTVKDFYLGKYEVTNEEFCYFLNEKGNQTEGVLPGWK